MGRVHAFSEESGKAATDGRRGGAAADPHGNDVRVRNGKMSATDGPFGPRRQEQLGGFYLLNAGT